MRTNIFASFLAHRGARTGLVRAVFRTATVRESVVEPLTIVIPLTLVTRRRSKIGLQQGL